MIDKNQYDRLQLEYFGCDCSTYEHTIRISYFLNDEPDEPVFYLNHPVIQYRTDKVPYFWTYHFWRYECFSKKEWKNFFYTTIWKRWYIALKYLFSKKNIDFNDGVFDCICLRNNDLERLIKTLSLKRDDTLSDEYLKFKLEQFKKRNIIFEVENTYYRLQLSIEDLEKEIGDGFTYPQHISTQLQLIRKTGIAKFIEAIYFGFGGTRPKRACNEWELNSADATILSYAVADFLKNLS
jgi:hypothetical protein